MALSIIRPFTSDDAKSLNTSALRFAKRHRLTLDLTDSSPSEALGFYLWFNDTGTWPRIKDLQRLWQACRCRSLGVAVAADIDVAYGYVGRVVK